MKKLVTVTGEISPEELGFCQCHEHIAISKGKPYEVNPDILIDDRQKNIEEVTRFHSAGGDSLIDAQPVGCHRMTEDLVEISRQTHVNVIASTGFHKMGFYPEDHWVQTIDTDSFAELMIHELTEGMFLDGDQHLPSVSGEAKAGIIKIAYDSEQLSPRYKRLYEAAAKAALATDRLLMIHVEQETNPVLLQDFLISLGMRPEDLIFCHMDRACKDINLHKEVLSKGSYLEFDTIGRFKYHSDDDEIQIFQELLAAGFERQILYSLDTTRARLKSYDENAIGLDYILTTFNQKLLDAGISEEMIHLFSVENPIAALTT